MTKALPPTLLFGAKVTDAAAAHLAGGAALESADFAYCDRVTDRVERFDRRGTEPFEPLEPFEPGELCQNSGTFPRKFKNFRKK